MIGKFEVYCAYCGVKRLTDVGGNGMWRSWNKFMVCNETCHNALDLACARSILGKDTPQDEV